MKPSMRCDYCGNFGCECTCPMCERARSRKEIPRTPPFRMTTGRTITELSHQQVKAMAEDDGLEYAANAYGLSREEAFQCARL
jgi:hypothetical protein